LLSSILRKLIHHGHLVVIDAKERKHGFGSSDTPAVNVRGHATERALFLNSQLALGEAYMDGRLIVEESDIASLLDLLTQNLEKGLWRRSLGMAEQNTPLDKGMDAAQYAFPREEQCRSSL
jgi:hypothetical protein